MKVYLAGPMANQPYFNFPKFNVAAKNLRAQGYEVFNPAENDVERHGFDISADNPAGNPELARQRHGFSIRDALAEDTAFICKEADAIAFMPGWEHSKGARAEHALGVALGLTFIYLR